MKDTLIKFSIKLRKRGYAMCRYVNEFSCFFFFCFFLFFFFSRWILYFCYVWTGATRLEQKEISKPEMTPMKPPVL